MWIKIEKHLNYFLLYIIELAFFEEFENSKHCV